jgi:hypothetical protein
VVFRRAGLVKTTPFLLCIPDNRIAQVIEDLDSYNMKKHKSHIEMPVYLTEKQQEVTFEYQGEEDVDKEMRKARVRD